MYNDGDIYILFLCGQEQIFWFDVSNMSSEMDFRFNKVKYEELK